MSLALQLPFCMPRAELRDLAGRLAEPGTALSVMHTARAILEPLYQTLLPFISKPAWQDNFWEEYYVFQFAPGTEVSGVITGWHEGEHVVRPRS